jgi:hypothetical protein
MVDQLQQPPPMRRTWFIIPAGIILPAISITVESISHVCAEHFFDPIPSLWHVMLVVFVPLAYLQLWRNIRSQQIDRAPLLAVTNAIAVGISFFYALVYIPLLPLAGIALVFFGLGLLGLAPLLALIAGLVLRWELGRMVSFTSLRSFWLLKRGFFAGIAIGFCFIALAELPSTLTRVGMQMAVSENLEKRARGIRLLQSRGNKDTLLRHCYWRSGHATDLIGYLLWMPNPVTPEQAREIYYRVTGQSFDSAPRPSVSTPDLFLGVTFLLTR